MEVLKMLFNEMAHFMAGMYGWIIVILLLAAVSNAIEKTVKLIGKQIAKNRRPTTEAQEIE